MSLVGTGTAAVEAGVDFSVVAEGGTCSGAGGVGLEVVVKRRVLGLGPGTRSRSEVVVPGVDARGLSIAEGVPTEGMS